MTRPKQPVQGQAYAKTPQMLGPAPSLPLNSRGEFRMTSPSLCVGDRGHPACPLSSGWCPGAACCPFPPQPGLSGPKEPSICAEDWFFLSVSFFSFLSPLSKTAWRLLLPLSPSSSKGPILSRRSDGGNSVNGRQDGWYPVPKVYKASWNQPPPEGRKVLPEHTLLWGLIRS